MQTGDTVLHKPSGETWSVAFVEGDELVPRGWPLSYAKVSDCELVTACSWEVRREILRDMAKMINLSDPRRQYARRALGLGL